MQKMSGPEKPGLEMRTAGNHLGGQCIGGFFWIFSKTEPEGQGFLGLCIQSVAIRCPECGCRAPVLSLQGSLACCSPWGHKESDTTKQLN